MLTGNLVAIAVGGIIASVSSVVWPDNFDFNITRRINIGPLETYEGDIPGTEVHGKEEKDGEKKGGSDRGSQHVHQDVDGGSEVMVLPDDIDPVALKKAFRFAVWSSVALVSSHIGCREPRAYLIVDVSTL